MTFEEEGFPVSNEQDVAILQHRDVHFGGNFGVMLKYYTEGGKGVNPEFELSQIEALALMEKDSGQNMAAMLLSGPDAERVAEAKDAYKKLRALYESKDKNAKYPQLIADLILTENEDPTSEIEAIVQEKSAIVPLLIDLLRSDTFYDPLFPGYGKAPALAARCLGLIGDKRAIFYLFESVGSGDFFDEDIALDALRSIGEPAKQFLLKVVHGKPINEDNERAAVALIKFKDDPEVAQTCFQMLRDKDVLKDLPLSTYLILACEGLTDKKLREEFAQLANQPDFPKQLKLDIKVITDSWK